MDEKAYNYYGSELKILDINETDIYKSKIKIYDSKGNNTKFISITFKQYKKIRDILISD